MRVYTNQRLIRRNHTLARVLVFGGLAILASGFVISFTNPDAITLVLTAALAGTLVAQAGIGLLNRWGRHPRLDEAINLALKGLDDRYAVFHYGLGAPHLVTGPPGTFALFPQNDDGDISLEEGRWWRDQPSRGLFRRGGRSELKGLVGEAEHQAQAAQRSLDRLLGSDSVPVLPLVVFTSDAATLHVQPGAAEVVALHRAKLKDWLRRASKGARLSEVQARQLGQDLGLASD